MDQMCMYLWFLYIQSFPYQEALKNNQVQKSNCRQQPQQRFTNQEWQLVIKVAAFTNRKTKRSGYAFEAITVAGRNLFTGGASCGEKSYCLAIQDAVGESMVKALELGYNRLLFLNCCKGLTQVCNQNREPSSLEKNLLLDLNQFRAQGLTTNFLFVPRDVVAHVIDLAYVTTCFPVHRCRLNPNFVQAWCLYYVFVYFLRFC